MDKLKNQMKKTSYFIFYILLLLTTFFTFSCNSKYKSIQKRWVVNKINKQTTSPIMFEFLPKKKLLVYDSVFTLTQGKYKIKKGNVICNTKDFKAELKIDFSKEDSVLNLDTTVPYHILNHKYKNMDELYEEFHLRKGKEKNFKELSPSLTAKTVEQRVLNVMNVFREGDFVTTKTIFSLIGIRAQARPGEHKGITQQRELTSRIVKIAKLGNSFTAYLENDKPIEEEIMILDYNPKTGKFYTKTTISVLVDQKAKMRVFEIEGGGIEVEFEGVKVGKGFFKVNIPKLTIHGNQGSLLGFKFRMDR